MIDMDAIRRKLNKLNGKGNSALWKPKEEGDYIVRLLPIQEAIEVSGLPILERYFYYDFCGKTIPAPSQFGLPDPVKELLDRCRAEGDNSMFKLLAPKPRDFAAIIVRGNGKEEDKGPFLWSLNKQACARVLGFFMDSDFGDISDVNKGYDLKVNLAKTPTGEAGRTWLKPTIDARIKPTKLSGDSALVEKWLGSIPNVDDVYPQVSYEELRRGLQMWLDGGSKADAPAETGAALDEPTGVDDALAELDRAFAAGG